MKKQLRRTFIIFAFLGLSNAIHSQCNIVTETSGIIHNSTSTIFVNYSCTVTAGASFVNIGAFTACGFTFPDVIAPWSGNTNVIDTVTYTFSEPITQVDVFIAYVGHNGSINPESFVFTTNGSIPVLTVNAGTCASWIIEGNQITSPPVINGLNSIATVTSATPFTTLKIISGANSMENGGSSYGLCDASLVTPLSSSVNSPPIPNYITLYPNPGNGTFTISQDNSNKTEIEIYNIVGELIYKATTETPQTKIYLGGQPKGIYFVRIIDNDQNVSDQKIVIQ